MVELYGIPDEGNYLAKIVARNMGDYDRVYKNPCLRSTTARHIPHLYNEVHEIRYRAAARTFELRAHSRKLLNSARRPSTIL